MGDNKQLLKFIKKIISKSDLYNLNTQAIRVTQRESKSLIFNETSPLRQPECLLAEWKQTAWETHKDSGERRVYEPGETPICIMRST